MDAFFKLEDRVLAYFRARLYDLSIYKNKETSTFV